MRFLVALLALLAAPLCAGTVVVGQPAPKFKAGGRLVNPYEFHRTLDDCKGDVIVVLEWNVKDLDSRKIASQLASTFKTWGGKGLWVFAVHRLRETPRELHHYCKAEGITYCVPMGGFYDEDNDFGHYVHEDQIYRTTVIGVDGNVAFYGRGDYDTVLQRELKKLVYPGLGTQVLAEKLAKAGRSFAAREYGAALAEAEKLAAGELTDSERESAQLIMDRAKDLATRRNERIAAWTADKRFDLAMPALEVMEKDFKGHELGKQAKAAFEAIRKDKANKDELKGYEDLKRLIDKSEPQGDQTLMNALKTWGELKKDLRAGKVALEMIKKIEQDSKKQE
ncbi:MAG: hypothetical protein KF754_07465 [Planctomycetes bacterium]|nr:hypothetical protein [Planctomycetota bacterium]